jgi:hypothetical protein
VKLLLGVREQKRFNPTALECIPVVHVCLQLSFVKCFAPRNLALPASQRCNIAGKSRALIPRYELTDQTIVFIGTVSFQVIQQKLVLKELAHNSAIFCYKIAPDFRVRE